MFRGDRGQELRAGDVQNGIVAADVNTCVSYAKWMMIYGVMEKRQGKTTVSFFRSNFIFVIYDIAALLVHTLAFQRELSVGFGGNIFPSVGAGCFDCDSLEKQNKEAGGRRESRFLRVPTCAQVSLDVSCSLSGFVREYSYKTALVREESWPTGKNAEQESVRPHFRPRSV